MSRRVLALICLVGCSPGRDAVVPRVDAARPAPVVDAAPRIEPDVDDSLEKPCGVNRITYPITYFIAGTNPAVAL